MKKIILIWVGIIVLIIGGVVIYGALTKSEGEVVEEIKYYDENGNIIEENLDKENITITGIDGNQYTFNPFVWIGQKYKICGLELVGGSADEKEKLPNVQEFIDAGFAMPNKYDSTLTFGEDAILVSRNGYGTVFDIKVYSRLYYKLLNYVPTQCTDDAELPGGLKLLEATLEDVEKLYGISEHRAGFATTYTVDYYQYSNKKGQNLHLIFNNEDDVLVGFEWEFR